MNSSDTFKNTQCSRTLRQALDVTGGFRPEHDITPELWDLYAEAMTHKVVWLERSFPLTDQVHLRLRLYFEPITRLSLIELPPWQSPNAEWSLLGYNDVVRILRDACGAGDFLKTSFADVEAAFILFCVSSATPRSLSKPSPDSPMDSKLELL